MKRIVLAILALTAFATNAATIVQPLPNNIQNGQPADATRLMGNFNQIVTNVNANAAAINAVNVFTQPQQFPAGTTPQQGVVVSQVQNDTTVWLGTFGGSVNALLATAYPAPSAYSSGNRWKGVAAYANTGAVTINLNSLGSRAVTKVGGSALVAGDIVAGQMLDLQDDGIRMQLMNPTVPDGIPYSDMGGTGNAITGTYTRPSSNLTIVDGMDLTVGMGATSNSSTTVTFTPTLNATLAATWNVVRYVGGAEVALAVGDLPGNAWLKADVPNTVWVLMNPVTVPTRPLNDSTLQPASTAFVIGQAATATPLADAATGAVGTSTTFARADHVHPLSTVAAGTIYMGAGASTAVTSSAVEYINYRVMQAGTYRVSFTLTAPGGTLYGQVFKNGVAYGTLFSTAAGPTVNVQDLAFALGDTVQVFSYGITITGTCTCVTDFKLGVSALPVYPPSQLNVGDR